MKQMNEIVEQSFIQYSGAVIQSRALVDVRDGLKPSTRQILYTMYKYGYNSNKPYHKTAAIVGETLKHFYIHGDSSAEGIIMRSAQHFALRYPFVEVKGNVGSQIESGNWAAPRYTESKLSKLGDMIFTDVNKDTILEWRDNYANDEQYPTILPTKGFYGICNGTSGIAVGMASSVPQFNIKELNNALIYLIDNPDCSFDHIDCAPNLATGGILYNEAEFKESMKKGTGFACKLRSVVEFDAKERCFIVTEIPYGVYTNTICGQLEEIVNGENNPGIERFNDLTGEKPLIKIYLSKKANPDKILKFLYKNTSLQSYFGINFTMLDMGRFPRVFTWKEMLQAHIDHEREVYKRGFEFDLKKIENRIHIIDGLLICLARIDEVVATIKSSASTAAASTALQKKFLLDPEQAKAVLDMKLSRLAHLEVKKLEDERVDLQKEADRIHSILNDDELFKNELKNGWREVAAKFGDARRTKIIELAADGDEPIEKKQLSLSFTNMGSVFVNETSTLYSQKRNGVGAKFKLEQNEYVIDSVVGDNTDTILFFTSHGNFYHVKMGDFIIGEKQYLSNFVTTLPYEHIVAAAIVSKQDTKPYIIFITKNGILKKSELSEYNLKRNVGATAIKLDEGDEIVSIVFTNDDKIGIASKSGNFIMITTNDIRPIGRVARGICGMKLNEGDYVVSARAIPSNSIEIASITEDGYIKRTDFAEFHITGRATKGVKLQKTEVLCDFLPLVNNSDILIVSSMAQIRIKLLDIPQLGRGTQGVKSLKLAENSKILNLSAV